MLQKSLSAFVPWLWIALVLSACGKEGSLPNSKTGAIATGIPSHSASVSSTGYSSASRDQAWLEANDPAAAARAYPTAVPTAVPTAIPTATPTPLPTATPGPRLPVQIGTPMGLSPGA